MYCIYVTCLLYHTSLLCFLCVVGKGTTARRYWRMCWAIYDYERSRCCKGKHFFYISSRSKLCPALNSWLLHSLYRVEQLTEKSLHGDTNHGLLLRVVILLTNNSVNWSNLWWFPLPLYLSLLEMPELLKFLSIPFCLWTPFITSPK